MEKPCNSLGDGSRKKSYINLSKKRLLGSNISLLTYVINDNVPTNSSKIYLYVIFNFILDLSDII